MNVRDIELNGQELQRVRKQAGYTQQEVADILGIKKATVSHYETDRKYPSANKLLQLLRLYRIKDYTSVIRKGV